MTPRQIELARHALGLSGATTVSYRNHFCASKGHVDFEDWMVMVEAGYATRRDPVPGYGGDDIFQLTRVAAETVLLPGEVLEQPRFPIGIDKTYASLFTALGVGEETWLTVEICVRSDSPQAAELKEICDDMLKRGLPVYVSVSRRGTPYKAG